MLIRWLLLFALLLSPAAWAAPTILVFGDSLSANYGLTIESGWVSLLQQRLRQNNYAYRIVNASISGETTAGGRARIDSAMAAHQPAIVILELGANDGLRGLPLQATRDNLDAIIRACRAAKSKVLLAGMRLPPNYGGAYSEGFSLIYPVLAKKHHTVLLPFLLEGIAGQRDFFQADNLHPTADAQTALLDNVWKYLKPMLRQ